MRAGSIGHLRTSGMSVYGKRLRQPVDRARQFTRAGACITIWRTSRWFSNPAGDSGGLRLVCGKVGGPAGGGAELRELAAQRHQVADDEVAVPGGVRGAAPAKRRAASPASARGDGRPTGRSVLWRRGTLRPRARRLGLVRAGQAAPLDDLPVLDQEGGAGQPPLPVPQSPPGRSVSLKVAAMVRPSGSARTSSAPQGRLRLNSTASWRRARGAAAACRSGDARQGEEFGGALDVAPAQRLDPLVDHRRPTRGCPREPRSRGRAVVAAAAAAAARRQERGQRAATGAERGVFTAPSSQPAHVRRSPLTLPRSIYEHVFVWLSLCVLIPRFALIAACGERRELLREPAALAPEPGGRAGGRRGLGGRRGARRAGGDAARRGALPLPRAGAWSRRPRARRRSAGRRMLRRLEGIGAGGRVRARRRGLLRGRRAARASTAAWPGRWPRRGAPVAMPARVAAAPTRFAAYAAAAHRAGGGRRRAAAAETIVPAAELRDFLSPLPVSLLAPRLGDERAARELVEALERLGIGELGALAALSAGARRRPLRPARDAGAAAGARRGGAAAAAAAPRGDRARASSCPRRRPGPQLERALELLVDRLLAAPQRRGRTVRALRLGAPLAGGGGWRSEVALRRPSASG